MIVNEIGRDQGTTGKLTELVGEYCRLHDQIVTGAKSGGFTAAGWAPMSELVDTKHFKRVGAYMDEMNWEEYLEFMTDWAITTKFDSTIKNISEAGRSVFYQIEERHLRGEESIVKNVMAVFVFNDEDKICHLDIYEQARDSGRWIIEAANDIAQRHK